MNRGSLLKGHGRVYFVLREFLNFYATNEQTGYDYMGTCKIITIHHECPCRIEISRPLIAQDKLFHRQNAVRNFLIPAT